MTGMNQVVPKQIAYAWCQNCCWQAHPLMLTGYSLRQLPCDRCGWIADLAIVKPKSE